MNIPKNFKYPIISDKDYVFGSGQVKGTVLRPDGDWRNFLPPAEAQRRNGVESSACFVEAEQHALATILEEQYGILDSNFAARFNLIYSNATPDGGDPLRAAQTFRDYGLIPDSMLPFSEEIKSWEEFRSFKGSNERLCQEEGRAWRAKWEPKYDIVVTREMEVKTKYAVLKEALKYSPIPVSVYGGNFDDGASKPPGVWDTHLVELIYIDDKNYPYVFDTYEPYVKKLAPLYNFDFGMRFTLEKNTVEQQISLIQRLLALARSLLDLLKQQPAEPMITRPNPLLTTQPPPSETLYQTAKAQLGKNLAPGNEQLGCAISLSAIYNKAFPKSPPLRFVNTTEWYNFMKNSPDWQELATPESDCVIVSVTSMIPPASPLKNGHIGIVGRKLNPQDNSLYIMSNDSFLKYWNTSFTLNKWQKFYQTFGKIPTFYFKKIA